MREFTADATPCPLPATKESRLKSIKFRLPGSRIAAPKTNSPSTTIVVRGGFGPTIPQDLGNTLKLRYPPVFAGAEDAVNIRRRAISASESVANIVKEIASPSSMQHRIVEDSTDQGPVADEISFLNQTWSACNSIALPVGEDLATLINFSRPSWVRLPSIANSRIFYPPNEQKHDFCEAVQIRCVCVLLRCVQAASDT